MSSHRSIHNSDESVAAFLKELRPQSLEMLETHDEHDFGPKTFRALSCHGESLLELNFSSLLSGTTPDIPLLKGCINLVSLSSTGNALCTSDLENSYNDVFLETIAWLKECKMLRSLTVAHFFSSPALMVPILLDSSIRLTSLDYKGFIMRDTKKFHQALANQTSLEDLYLKLITDEDALEYPTNIQQEDLEKLDADFLVESLSKLVNLTKLHFSTVSDSFNDGHIMQLASSLPKLEYWSISGNCLTDAIWKDITSLKSLQSLNLHALSSLTADGILGFLDKVDPRNKLFFSVRSVKKMAWDKRALIHKKMNEWDGVFTFTLTSSGYWHD